MLWSADAGTPVPERFRVLAFPKNVEALTIDGDVLDRAAIFRWDDWRSEADLQVWLKGESAVRHEDVTALLPSDAEMETLVERLKTQLEDWGNETDFKKIELRREPGSEPPLLALTIAMKDGEADTFSYRVIDDDVSPVSWSATNGKARAFAGLAWICFGAAFTLIAVAAGIRIWSAFRRKRVCRLRAPVIHRVKA